MPWPCDYFSSYLLSGGKKVYIVEERGSYLGAYTVDAERVASVVQMAADEAAGDREGERGT